MIKINTIKGQKKTLAKYSSEPLVITWSVLTENCHLLLQRSITKQKGVEKQVQLINLFDQYPEMFKIFNIREHHFPKMKELMKKICKFTNRFG